MGVYLEDHPPESAQYRAERRAEVSGGIVVHDTESPADLVGPDGGAEAVASFISTRSDPGSYHTLFDSDSILRLGRYEWEMFGEGTGGNRWAIHIAAAYRKAQWPNLPPDFRHRTLVNAARAAADAARWVRATTGIVVPAIKISPADYRARRPGFLGHGDIDPDRRTDPGWSKNDWLTFLQLYGIEMDRRRAPVPSLPPPVLPTVPALALLEVIDMPLPTEVKFTWSLLDLPECQAIVVALYHLAGNEDTAGMAYWDDQLVLLLEQGKDPRPLLAQISKQLRGG